MILVLLGPPGCGKGTQAKFIAAEFRIPHVSTGDMFREAAGRKTSVGLKAREYMERGDLVPDDITIDIVDDRVKLDDCANGFLLDGFPRTIPQAEALDEILKKSGRGLTNVLSLEVDDGIIIERLSGRRMCRACHKIYHISSGEILEKCTECGGEIFQRDDDKPEAIQNRIAVYKQNTAPLIEFYNNAGLLKGVPGNGTIDDIKNNIYSLLKEIQKNV